MKNSRRISCVLMFVLASLTISTNDSQAARIGVGWQTQIHKIQDIRLKGPKGEALYLGVNMRVYFLIAGVFLLDEGLVLGIEGNRGSYYPMPEGDKLIELQNAGILPKDLSDYQIPIIYYIIGYSLWILILGGFLYNFIKRSIWRRRISPNTEN